jgi:aspartate kinase
MGEAKSMAEKKQRIVMKFGGTSVMTTDRIKHVASRIERYWREGTQVAVVVSAMGHETDRLVSLAREISPQPDEREMDLLLSSGERVSIALLAMALHERGVKARSFTGRQVGIMTDQKHTKAKITEIRGDRLRAALERGEVAVVAGFQGINSEDDVTTLGRGGSDLTAVALAHALAADMCEIYTDVLGVFTADPRMVENARKLDRITYEEMLELASLGAQVLQTRSVMYGMKYRVPLKVLSTFSEDPGTVVVEEDASMEDVLVAGVALNKDETKVTIRGVPDKPGIAARIFTPLAEAGVVVDMILQNLSADGFTDLTFTVPKADAERLPKVLEPTLREVQAGNVLVDNTLAKVSIVGSGMRTHAGVAARMFKVLADAGINIYMISTSEIKISCMIDAKYAELAVRLLHEAFALGKKE